MTKEEIGQTILDTMRQHGPQGSLVDDGLDTYYCTAIHCPGASCTVRCDIHDDEVKVRVNWSGAHRSIAQAQAAIALYQEMTNLAALLESLDLNAEK